jgi:HEAT repeat protein
MLRKLTLTFVMTALLSGVPGLAQAPVAADVTDRIITALVGALKDPDRDVRRNAAHALSGFENARIVEPMTSLLKDEDVQLRKHAANALARLGDERAVPALITALKDADPEVRVHAARALGQVGDARAVDPLTAALKDENVNVRRTAIRALGAIADGKGGRKSGMLWPKVAWPQVDMVYVEDAERRAIERVMSKIHER